MDPIPSQEARTSSAREETRWDEVLSCSTLWSPLLYVDISRAEARKENPFDGREEEVRRARSQRRLTRSTRTKASEREQQKPCSQHQSQ